MTRHLHHSVAHLMRLYHFTRERERGACEWYMVWNSCLHSVTYLLPYTVYLISYIVYCCSDYKSRVVNWIWKMESRSGNLHFVHNLFTFSDNLAALCCKLRVPLLPCRPLDWLVYLGHFCMHTKVICLHDDKFHTAPSFLPLSLRPEIIFALTYNRKLWQQQQSWERSERGRT